MGIKCEEKEIEITDEQSQKHMKFKIKFLINDDHEIVESVINMASKGKENMEEAKEGEVEEEAKEEENKEAKDEEKEKEATDGGRELSGIVLVLNSADGAQHTIKLDQ